MIIGRIEQRRFPATTGIYLLSLILLLLGTSCNRQLNQRNGRYYSARDMVRMKRGERVTGTRTTRSTRAVPSRPSRPALAKTKVKTTVPSTSGSVAVNSALLQLSFADAGVDIPRSSNEQAAWGDPIKPTELQPGDFLFFGASPGSNVITHVGMVTVVDEEGVEFIHASTSLGVVENDFELDYYLSRFIRAVRPRL
jgi:probable lipoprotein NlpC